MFISLHLVPINFAIGIFNSETFNNSFRLWSNFWIKEKKHKATTAECNCAKHLALYNISTDMLTLLWSGEKLCGLFYGNELPPNVKGELSAVALSLILLTVSIPTFCDVHYQRHFIFTLITGLETIKTTDWLQTKVRECRLGLQPRLNASPVCNTQCRWGGIYSSQCYINAEPLPFNICYISDIYLFINLVKKKKPKMPWKISASTNPQQPVHKWIPILTLSWRA